MAKASKAHDDRHLIRYKSGEHKISPNVINNHMLVSTYTIDDFCLRKPNSIDPNIAEKLACVLRKYDLSLETMIHVVTNCTSYDVRRYDKFLDYVTFEMYIFNFVQFKKPVIVDITYGGKGNETMTRICWDDICSNTFWKKLHIFLTKRKWRKIILKHVWMLHRFALKHIREDFLGQLEFDFTSATKNILEPESNPDSNGIDENSDDIWSLPESAPKHVPKHARK